MTDLSVFDDSFPVLIVADPVAASVAAARAVALAQGRVVATVGWADAARRIADQVGPATLLLETAGVADDQLAPALAAIADLPAPAGRVVTFAAERIDLVSDILLDGDAVLLCDPGVEDRVAGLVLAAVPRGISVHDTGDAGRIARINQEVARFAETLARLTGSSPEPAGPGGAAPIVGDRQLGFGTQPASDEATPAELRRAIRARRLREETFGVPGLFEDPAWDILLDLFAAELERRRVSVSSLCIAAAVAPTTALRWIGKLIALGLLERRPDDFDRRRAFIALTAQASTTMRNYVAAARRAGLALA